MFVRDGPALFSRTADSIGFICAVMRRFGLAEFDEIEVYGSLLTLRRRHLNGCGIGREGFRWKLEIQERTAKVAAIIRA